MVDHPSSYRGRLAPSPTGWLHLGHARTFWTAQQRARSSGGVLILRNDDLDAARCRPEFATGMIEDLKWFGFTWDEGPDVGGAHFPYDQSKRREDYAAVFEELRETGVIYPCTCSRKDVQASAAAPHENNDEPLYPGTCRPENVSPARRKEHERLARRRLGAGRVNWRFRVPDGEPVAFEDGGCGPQRAVAGADFGDFLVWRKDGVPGYQLACVADDSAMGITEVVRGADLVMSTFRQLLLFRALLRPAPEFFHGPLVNDEHGVRLAKRHHALALRTLRAAGRTPADLRAGW